MAASLLATLQPVTLPGWEDFAMVATEPIGNGFIRTNRPMQAYRYNYRYGPPDSRTRTVEDWYLLGPYLVKISATAASDIWVADQYLELRKQLELALDTFELSTFTDTQNVYSVAHPPSWQALSGDLADYWAEDAVEEQRVFVKVRQAEGWGIQAWTSMQTSSGSSPGRPPGCSSTQAVPTPASESSIYTTTLTSARM